MPAASPTSVLTSFCVSGVLTLEQLLVVITVIVYGSSADEVWVTLVHQKKEQMGTAATTAWDNCCVWGWMLALLLSLCQNAWSTNKMATCDQRRWKWHHKFWGFFIEAVINVSILSLWLFSRFTFFKALFWTRLFLLIPHCAVGELGVSVGIVNVYLGLQVLMKVLQWLRAQTMIHLTSTENSFQRQVSQIETALFYALMPCMLGFEIWFIPSAQSLSHLTWMVFKVIRYNSAFSLKVVLHAVLLSLHCIPTYFFLQFILQITILLSFLASHVLHSEYNVLHDSYSRQNAIHLNRVKQCIFSSY